MFKEDLKLFLGLVAFLLLLLLTVSVLNLIWPDRRWGW